MREHDQSEFDRREFLQAGTLATASALALGATSTGQAQDAAAAKPAILPTRKLGKTGVDVTILNLGTGAWRGAAGADRLLRQSYAGGIRYIDTANFYGTEPDVAKFFKAMPEARKDTFVVTKDTPKRIPDLVPLLDKRLETLQMDSVDLYFLHGLGDTHKTVEECMSILQGKELKEVAEAVKKSGKAKFFGFSCHNENKALFIAEAAKLGYIDAIMVAFTPWFDKKSDETNRALDAAHKAGIGLISMKQLAGQHKETLLKELPNHAPTLKDKGLTGYQMLLHAIWTDERIASCCVSMRNGEQMIENIAAAKKFTPLTTAEMKEVHNLFLASSPTMCANCDGRCALAGKTDAALGDLARFLTYHEHHGQKAEARRLYSEMTDAARDWKGADLAAAQEACHSNLNFSELLERAEKYLA